MRVCPKCRAVAAAELVAASGGVEFRRCTVCQQMTMTRAQAPRGTVQRAGFIFTASEAAGSFVGRVMPDPKWYPAALLRGAQ